MDGRLIAWAIVGVCIGLRAVVKARGSIGKLRRSGTVFGESHSTEVAVISPLLALVGLGVCVRLAQVFDGNLTVLAHVVFVSACLVLALIDIDTHVLPRRTTYGALALGVPVLVLARIVDHEGSLVSAFIGAVGLFMVLNVLAVLSRGGLGGGDVTLGLLLGAFVGFRGLVDVALGLATGFVAGGVWAVALVASRRATGRTRFAFGPFLILGALVAVLR